MPRRITKHIATITAALPAGNQKYAFKSPEVYDTLETETGISIADTDDEKALPNVSVGELLGAGLVERITVAYEEAGKLKSARILIAQGKTRAALVGKTYKGVTGTGGIIKSVRVARRASYV